MPVEQGAETGGGQYPGVSNIYPAQTEEAETFPSNIGDGWLAVTMHSSSLKRGGK